MYIKYYFFALFVTSKIVLSSCRSPLAIDYFLTAMGSPVSPMCLITYHTMPVLSHPVSLLSEIHQVKQSCRQITKSSDSKPDEPLVLRPCELGSKIMASY